jgi:ElaB/YqjD/DUF883 family membrane-anchored ribosome-binding protein
MKHAVLVLGIVCLLIFPACEKGEKHEEPMKTTPEGAVEQVEHEARGVTQELEQVTKEAAETSEHKAAGVVEEVEHEAHGVTQELEQVTKEAAETSEHKAAGVVEEVEHEAAGVKKELEHLGH